MDELGAATPRGARLGRGRELVYILLENLKQRVDNILQMRSFHTLAVLMTRDERTCERAKAPAPGALSMPPRVEAPGLTNLVENIPEFRVPDSSRYDI